MKFEIESGVLAGLARTAGATLGGKNVAAWSNAFYLKADSENDELTIRSTNGTASCSGTWRARWKAERACLRRRTAS